MRGRAIAAIVASMVVMSGHLRSQERLPPDLGYGPETFDWSAGWLSSVFSFLFATLVLVLFCALVILLVCWVILLWHRAQASQLNRPARGRG